MLNDHVSHEEEWTVLTREEVLAVIEKHEKLDFKELKVSYLILKPNAARHYKVIVNEIEKQQYTIT